MFFDRGFVGLSAATYDSTYGTVAEPNVTIGMRQNRYDLAGELRDLGFIESPKVKATYTDYQHIEYNRTTPGTVFTNQGYETRADFRHRKLGMFEGAFGVQASDSRFQALGDEAFVPPVTTRMLSAFLYEEMPLGPIRLSAGGRADSVKLDAGRERVADRRLHVGQRADQLRAAADGVRTGRSVPAPQQPAQRRRPIPHLDPQGHRSARRAQRHDRAHRDLLIRGSDQRR